jgi:hypothetical protein
LLVLAAEAAVAEMLTLQKVADLAAAVVVRVK